MLDVDQPGVEEARLVQARRRLGAVVALVLRLVRDVGAVALLTVAGLLLIVVTPWLATNIVGFLLIGIGAANVVPVLFSAAGKADANSPELALAAVTTMGYAGQLAGPALIGFAAHVTSLPVALGLLAGPLVLVALGFRTK